MVARMCRSGGRVFSSMVIASAFMASAAISSPVQAQVRVSSSFGGPGGAPDAVRLTKSDLKDIAKIVQFTPEQSGAAEALLEAYATECRAASKQFHEAVKGMESDMDIDDLHAHTKKIGEAAEASSKKTRELKAQFMNDLKALLTPEQAGKWDRVERLDRRREFLPRGVLAGESMNLLEVVNDLNLPEPRSNDLSASLDTYELDLDSALQARERAREARGGDDRRNAEGGDLKAIRAMMGEHRKLGIPVRDVNAKYAKVIAGVLPESARPDFERRVREKTYPRVYKPGHTAKSIDAALDLKDLDAPQRAKIAAIRDEYERQSRTMNDSLAAAIAAEEKDGGGGNELDSILSLAGDKPAGAEESPAKVLRRQRKDLDKDTLAKVKGSLREDQVAKLPKKQNNMFEGLHDAAEGEGAVMIHAISVTDDGSGEAVADQVIIRGDGGDGADGGSSTPPKKPD